jgi:acetyl-CoA synthetase (ADP-forming)
MQIIQDALKRRSNNLSEYDSKRFLANFGIPVTREAVVRSEEEAVTKASEIGYPVVLKGSGEALRHKTELDMIGFNLKDKKSVRRMYSKLTRNPKAKVEEVLVQKMIEGDRELMVGLFRDPQFGPCVMFGLGGILTEVVEDTAFRVTPLARRDALEVMEEIKGKKILDTFRGKPCVDREALADILLALSQIGTEHQQIREIDINPLKLVNGKPIAVDALVVFSSEPP